MLQHGHPIGLAVFHAIQLLLHVGGESQIHNIGEILLHQLGHHLAKRGGLDCLALPLHIFAGEDGADGRGIGGGATDAAFLHSLDQRGLIIPRRRLGEMLVALQLPAVQCIPLPDLRQGLIILILFVLALHIQRRVAVKAHRVAGGLEPVLPGRDHHLAGILDGICHQAGHKPLPDQLIQPVLVGRKRTFHLLRRQRRGGRADRLMGVLGIALGLVNTGLRRQILLPVGSADILAAGLACLVRNAQ